MEHFGFLRAEMHPKMQADLKQTVQNLIRLLLLIWFCIVSSYLSVLVFTIITVNTIFFQDSSVYICILMDYFPKGTLEHVLNKCREKKEVIDEEVGECFIIN